MCQYISYTSIKRSTWKKLGLRSAHIGIDEGVDSFDSILTIPNREEFLYFRISAQIHLSLSVVARQEWSWYRVMHLKSSEYPRNRYGRMIMELPMFTAQVRSKKFVTSSWFRSYVRDYVTTAWRFSREIFWVLGSMSLRTYLHVHCMPLHFSSFERYYRWYKYTRPLYRFRLSIFRVLFSCV
jgi:hypothetical protein